MLKLRTMHAAHKELKRMDPDTAIGRQYFIDLVKNDKIPSIKKGSQYLVAMEDVESYFKGQLTKQG